MSAILLPVLKQRHLDANGIPLVGGQLFSYVAGTSVPAATYVDQLGITPNTNPVILDSQGYANVWLGSGSYKFVLEDANDVVIFTVDNVSVSASASGSSPWVKHAVTDGQSAGDLIGETVDFAIYTSAFFNVEIIRGTTVVANGQCAIQNVNGTGRVSSGSFMAKESNGVTFSVSQLGMICQLRAALSSGPGDGTIKLLKQLVPI